MIKKENKNHNWMHSVRDTKREEEEKARIQFSCSWSWSFRVNFVLNQFFVSDRKKRNEKKETDFVFFIFFCFCFFFVELCMCVCVLLYVACKKRLKVQILCWVIVYVRQPILSLGNLKWNIQYQTINECNDSLHSKGFYGFWFVEFVL